MEQCLKTNKIPQSEKENSFEWNNGKKRTGNVMLNEQLIYLTERGKLRQCGVVEGALGSPGIKACHCRVLSK